MALIFDSLPDFWAQRSQHWALWLLEVAASEGKRLGDFNYRFHTDDELLELNRRFLDHDTYTDIITFDRTRGNRIAADVAVSWERVLDNASRLGSGTRLIASFCMQYFMHVVMQINLPKKR